MSTNQKRNDDGGLALILIVGVLLVIIFVNLLCKTPIGLR